MIKVTEEQAKVIEKEFKELRDGNQHNVAWSIAMDTDLDLVTIARIVEGEPYEVKGGV